MLLSTEPPGAGKTMLHSADILFERLDLLIHRGQQLQAVIQLCGIVLGVGLIVALPFPEDMLDHHCDDKGHPQNIEAVQESVPIPGPSQLLRRSTADPPILLGPPEVFAALQVHRGLFFIIVLRFVSNSISGRIRPKYHPPTGLSTACGQTPTRYERTLAIRDTEVTNLSQSAGEERKGGVTDGKDGQ